MKTNKTLTFIALTETCSVMQSVRIEYWRFFWNILTTIVLGNVLTRSDLKKKKKKDKIRRRKIRK